MAILVPKSATWMVRGINSILMKQGLFLVAAKHGKYIYHRQLTMAWTVAVIEYSDKTQINEVKFASKSLLLLDRKEEHHPEPVIPFQRIVHSDGSVLEFSVLDFKGHGHSTIAANSLSVSEIKMAAQLSDIAPISKTTIGVARVSESKELSAFETLILQWLTFPAKYDTSDIYLRFSYDSVETPFFNREMARQFTEEIMPNGSHVADRSDSQMHVFVSCSVYELWILAGQLEDLSQQYPLLATIQEVSASDVSEINEDIEPEDQVAETSNLRFSWPMEI